MSTDEPSRRPRRAEGAPQTADDSKRRVPWLWLLFAGLLLLNWILASVMMGPPSRARVSYTFFTHQVHAGNVQAITSTANSIEGNFKAAVAYPPQGGTRTQVTRFITQRPTFANDQLLQMLQSKGVVINANAPDAGPPVWQQLLLGFGPTLLLVGLLVWVSRRAAAGVGSGLGGFGRSRAKLYQSAGGPRTTFADVAGIDEVKHEVLEIVDFLRRPEKYRALGAEVPRGVLLSGPPGTGKTLLARAVAGEANVPFFSVSASEFIEALVGVGASRVRDLFDQAKKVAPAIIFIDELDAIGRSRGGASSFGGNDEREQTLNQILTEMDGFTGNENVIVIGATNRPEVLDTALLRPGRFDRRVVVSAPDVAGRRQILQVHARDVPLAPDVDLAVIAASTSGMVGADLKNLVNEAALTAARRGVDQVGARDFSDAIEKITLGAARGIMLTADEKRRTAFHESGHALLGMLTPGADPVRKVSIIPRGQALGVTFQSPVDDRYSYSENYLRGRIVGALGGRAAEEVVFGDVTTGAENDLEQVTRIARQMVGRWGMSERIGPVSVLTSREQQSPFGDSGSTATGELIDAEVRRIVEECYEQALQTLRANRERLEQLSSALLQHETLDETEAYAAAGLRQAPVEAVPRGAASPVGS